MSTTSAANGRPQRKQLSDQLDRLDGIIDCMADGLNKAVADAAREGSREAVKEILTELLTNPDILTMIRAAVGSVLPAPVPTAPEPATPMTPPTAPASRGPIASIVRGAAQRVKSVITTTSSSVSRTIGFLTTTVNAVRRSPRLKKAVVIGTGVGLAAVVVASTNHTVAAVLSGAGAAATAVAVQVGGWFGGARRRLGLT